MRPKPCRLALYRELRWRVAQKLALQWSPQQISGWLKQEFPAHQYMQISHEAIYRSLSGDGFLQRGNIGFQGRDAFNCCIGFLAPPFAPDFGLGNGFL